ncbi:PAS domain S-box protein [candidate division KSB1 bacterium]|nr:PAS domain S-box protein [candidate division KSB1 bacterium]
MIDTPLYNSKITSQYISYIQTHYTSLNVEEILANANMTMEQVLDPSHWFTHEQIVKFHQELARTTANPEIAYHVGKAAGPSESLSAFKKYLLGLINPARAFQSIETIYPKLSKATRVRVRKFGFNRVVIVTSPKPGIPEEPFQCLNRQGSFEALAKLFTNHYANVSHKKCIHKGDKECEYVITWKNLWSTRMQRALPILIILSLLLMAALAFLLPFSLTVLLGAGLIIVNLVCGMLFLAMQNREYAKIIGQQGNVANDLIDEANERYNNALLIQEIGQAITLALDEDKITQSFMDVMRKRLDYDRGFIMLLDNKRQRLVFSSQFGFSQELIPVLQKASVRSDAFESHTILQQTLMKQKPFITHDFVKEKSSFNKTLYRFIQKIKAHATIVVPIVYEKESLGILAVDNIQSKRAFTQTDVSLLSGLASEIAIGLANAHTFQEQINSEQRYGLLVEHMPIGLFTVNRDGRIVSINPKMVEILAISKEHILGQHINDIRSFTHAPLLQSFAQIIAEGKPAFFQHRIFSLSGEKLELFCTIVPIRDKRGNVSDIQVMAQDITDLKRMESELYHAQKMESMGILAGGVAHDFNNILSAIIGFTELAKKENANNSRLQGQLSNILRASERARDLVNQILLFSHRTEPDLKPLKLDNALKDAIKLVRAFLPANIEIQLDISPTRLISSDITQIHQIVMNLASNAAFAMRDKGGILSIQLLNQSVPHLLIADNVSIPAGDYVVLIVSDSGCGIPADHLSKIYDPFYTTKERGEGTGMGLAVVHGILKSQNGYIMVESRVNEGTTFRLYWPALDESIADDSGKPFSLPTGTEHILFVDDEALITEFAADMLMSLGYRVTTYTDGQAAFDFYRANYPDIDLLITDLTMPELTGEQLAAMALKLKPSLPVIVLTGFSERITSQIAIHHIVSKPFNLQDMAWLIRKTLDTK